MVAGTVRTGPTYLLTFRPETGLEPEAVEADRVTVEPMGLVVLHRTVVVFGSAREVVVRRLSGSQVQDVSEVPATRMRPGSDHGLVLGQLRHQARQDE